MSARQFPMPRPENDPRFTFGLTLEIAEVLAKHGYPDPRYCGVDVVELQQALFSFLYTKEPTP